MTLLITIVAFLVILVVLILVHEFGHFITAKASGVKVEEFGLGFPPRIAGFKHGETIYSINAIPLGGFTKMAGEEDPKVPRSLASQSVGIRLVVLAAGSIMNLILPFLLFSVAFMVPHNVVVGEVMVVQVQPNSPAALAGMEPGDLILSINGEKVNNISDLHRLIQLNLGKEAVVQIKKPGLPVKTVELVPRWRPPEGEGATGIAVSLIVPTSVRESEPFWRAFPLGARECVETLVLFKNEIISWSIGTTAPQVVGPVGIAQLTGVVARAGLGPLIEFAAFISINLGIVNLFPLPALDGGRIVFVLIEVVRRGKRVSPKTEGLVHLIGFTLLIAVILVVTYRDIFNIVTGSGPIP